jgi:hypothetical protein
VAHIIRDEHRLDDADTLERAAAILRSRSRKPGGILLAAFCKVLNGEARKLRAEAGR